MRQYSRGYSWDGVWVRTRGLVDFGGTLFGVVGRGREARVFTFFLYLLF